MTKQLAKSEEQAQLRPNRWMTSVMMPMVKILVSFLGIVLALRLQFGDGLAADYSYGVKGVMFAFGGAVALFYELLPNGNADIFTRVAPWLTRLAGALLALLATWNLLLDQTNGEPFPLLAPAAAIGLFVITIPAILIVTALTGDTIEWCASLVKDKQG